MLDLGLRRSGSGSCRGARRRLALQGEQPGTRLADSMRHSRHRGRAATRLRGCSPSAPGPASAGRCCSCSQRRMEAGSLKACRGCAPIDPSVHTDNFSTAICPFSAGSMWHLKSRKYSATRKRFFRRTHRQPAPGRLPVDWLSPPRSHSSVAEGGAERGRTLFSEGGGEVEGGPAAPAGFPPTTVRPSYEPGAAKWPDPAPSSILARGGSIRWPQGFEDGIQLRPSDADCLSRTRKNASKCGGV